MPKSWILANPKDAMIEVAVAIHGPVLEIGEKYEVYEKEYVDQLNKELYDLRKAVWGYGNTEVQTEAHDKAGEEIDRLMGDWSPENGENNSGDNPAAKKETHYEN